jgi:hypothetical protein
VGGRSITMNHSARCRDTASAVAHGVGSYSIEPADQADEIGGLAGA